MKAEETTSRDRVYVVVSKVINDSIPDNHLFEKESCPHCKRAKGDLEQASIIYDYHDIVSSPRGLYEMLARVKPHIGPKIPITVPQIWNDGNYIGGADQLRDIVKQNVEPNYDRGQCSLSPSKDN